MSFNAHWIYRIVVYPMYVEDSELARVTAALILVLCTERRGNSEVNVDGSRSIADTKWNKLIKGAQESRWDVGT